MSTGSHGGGESTTFAAVYEVSDRDACAAYQRAGWPVVYEGGAVHLRCGAEALALVTTSSEGDRAVRDAAKRFGKLPEGPTIVGGTAGIVRVFRAPPGTVLRSGPLHADGEPVHRDALIYGASRGVILPPSVDGVHLRWPTSYARAPLAWSLVPLAPQWLLDAAVCRAKPRAARQTAIPPRALLACTDLGNAERFAARHGGDVRWCEALGAWLTWDGVRWVTDQDGEAMRRAAATVRSLVEEIDAAPTSDEREALEKHRDSSEQLPRLRALLDLAKTLPGITVQADALDADPWILCCENATVDLRTGEAREHRRDDLCTKMVPAAWEPDADASRWEGFLLQCQQGDRDVVDFLRRAVGYSLTASTREEKYFFVHGPGGSGKSTFLEAMKSTLGDYARTVSMDVFMEAGKSNAGAATPEIARLAGARFVASAEMAEGRKLDEETLLRLTGGDTITCRALYGDTFELHPTFKVWMVANYAPRVSDRATGIWRRVIRVPFENALPAEQRDPALKAYLTSAEARPAILRWAVQGAREWHTMGLSVPDCITSATEQYRAEQDPLHLFWQLCAFEPTEVVSRKGLRDAYEAWNKTEGTANPLSPKVFAQRVRDRLVATYGPHHNADTTTRVAGSQSPVNAWRGVSLAIVHPDDMPGDL